MLFYGRNLSLKGPSYVIIVIFRDSFQSSFIVKTVSNLFPPQNLNDMLGLIFFFFYFSLSFFPLSFPEKFDAFFLFALALPYKNLFDENFMTYFFVAGLIFFLCFLNRRSQLRIVNGYLLTPHVLNINTIYCTIIRD